MSGELRALELFDALVDLAPDARAGELEKLKTEDAALHARVVSLLEADARGGVLEKTVLSLLAPTEEAVPSRIGPWRITGVAGRGGMGAVYEGARDDGQFQQRAALKLIRLGMDTPQLRARFLRERQILAGLQHPHIATLLDGGVTDTGAPYFAMERVEGQPIDAWCDEKKLSLRARVELFLQVCAAVQYAHQRLVVHRDLKPGNVLIDGDGQAKLLDFGIAKLLDADALDGATQERPHTPDYAAPEQLSGDAITTATDVYALGVMLHGLLSGAAPRDVKTPLSLAGERVTEAQVLARSQPSKVALSRALRGDLSAIVQQCVQPEPRQRYASVAALADDLRAWLDGRPVRARLPTRRYLLRKFVSRHRGGVAAAVVLVLVLAGGVAGVWWQAQRAQKAADEAQAQLDYLSSLLQVLAPSTAEARELDRSRLIAEAARRARDELAHNPESLAGVELSLARIAQNVGDYAQGVELADAAVKQRAALHGDDALVTAEARLLAGALRTQVRPARVDEAAKLLDDALVVIRRRAPGSAVLVDALQKRATLYGDQDRLAEQANAIGEAAALCDGALATEVVCEEVWLEQGAMASRNRQHALALPPLRRAWDARKKRLGAEHAATLHLAGLLAWAQADSGDLSGGLELAEEVYAANQRIYTQPTETTLRATLRLARVLQRVGNYERAEQLTDEYLAHSRRLFGEDNQNTILGYSDRASLLFGVGRFDEAATQFALAAQGYKKAKADINAALTLGFQCDALREAGHAADALPLQVEAVDTLRAKYPKGENVMLARALTNLGLTELSLGQKTEALAHLEASVAMHRKLQAKGAPGAAHAEAFRALVVFESGRAQEAEAAVRAAVKELEPVKRESASLYWGAFSVLTKVACANGAADCEALRGEARGALSLVLPAATRRRLQSL